MLRVHRDGLVVYQPANLLMEDFAKGVHTKVADFGLSTAVQDEEGLVGKGNIMGTLMYAAPEVLARQGASTASDIYSLGVVMWEVFTCRTPFGNVPGWQT